jgi:hypothetical protein
MIHVIVIVMVRVTVIVIVIEIVIVTVIVIVVVSTRAGRCLAAARLAPLFLGIFAWSSQGMDACERRCTTSGLSILFSDEGRGSNERLLTRRLLVTREQIAWLRQELIAMDTRQRRAFVKFVTASVCMPAEGNPIVVHPQVTTRQDGEDGDSKLPTSRTCTNVLYLPAYSSASLLKRRLGQAIWEEHIEFD